MLAVVPTTGEIVRVSDLTDLVIPTQVPVPDTIEAVATVLEGVGGLLAAGHWGTAAIVYAWTEPQQGARTDVTSIKSDGSLSIDAFAALDIRGLGSINTVRKYRRAWEHAVEQGWAEESRPGEPAELPLEAFKLATEAHVSNNSGENEWYTPPKYVEAARATMGGIDLDPASSATANKIVGATNFFTEYDNGLEQEWEGRVWMNPPYAQPLISDFATKLVQAHEAGAVTQGCVLVNNATETGWWQGVAQSAAAVCFPKGRVKFWHPEREAAPLQGQAVLYLGDNVSAFIEAHRSLGTVWVKP